MEMRNRVVMAPMGANLAEADGRAGERMQRYFEARAAGGAGLLIVDVAAVAFPAGASNPLQLSLGSDDVLPSLSALCDAVHRHGAGIAVQLHHGGKVAVRDIIDGRPMWVPSAPRRGRMDLYDDLSPDDLAAATEPILSSGNAPQYHEMTTDDIATAQSWYSDAAERAREAGFDGVELHAGHGYLIQSFLSPASNLRTDEYGGARESRVRFLVETIGAVRARVGAEMAVWVRIDGCEHGIAGGLTEDDARANAAAAVDAGADAVHVSAYADPGRGALFTVAPLPDAPNAYLDLARGVKQVVDAPVIAVGRIEPDAADAAIRDGHVDFVAMGRKLLADPDLPRKLAAGTPERIRPCIYTYRCVGNVFLMRSAACAVNPVMGREHMLGTEIERADRARRVLVVGGGPAGMETARIAALRGHEVALVERDTRLGGLARLAAHVDPPVGALVAWLEGELARLDVDVRVGAGVDPTEAREDADVVVLAVGASQDPPPIPDDRVLDLAALLHAFDAARPPFGRIAILGGDAVAVQLGACFARSGDEVTLLERGAHIGGTLSPPKLWRRLAELRDAGATLVKGASVEQVTDDLVVEWRTGDERSASSFDAIVVTGRSPGEPAHDGATVGDAVRPGGFDEVFQTAFDVARSI
jgi:2,4-dienoyl-CoA reductase (NADPH2)